MFDLNQFQMYNSQETQIKEKCYKFNAKLEIPLPKIIACLENSFVEKKENCKFTLIQNENEHELLSIKLNTKIVEGVPFEWTFEMKRMNESAIRDHLVMPLLFNLTEKNARETELIEIIKNKDRLIDDFTRTQGIKSNLKHISTEEFVMANFDEAINKKSQERRDAFFEAPQSCLVYDSVNQNEKIYSIESNKRKRLAESKAIAESELKQQQTKSNEQNKQKKLKKANSNESEKESTAAQQKALLEQQLESERLKALQKLAKTKKPALKL